jgi:pimeloyl-ACP methyl ester carboxylesterase
MAGDVIDFMDQHELETAHLLGHSMGGKTAMQAALTAPGRVDRLVVADMAPKAYPPHHTPILEALAALDPTQYDSRSTIDDALAEAVASWPVRQFLLKNLNYDGTRYRWQMNLDAIRANYDAVVDAIDVDATFGGPARFIAGGRSDYVTEDDLPRIRTQFPQAELVTIDDAGHWVHADAPEAFADAVMTFLTAPVPSP